MIDRQHPLSVVAQCKCSLPRQLDTPMGDISAGLGCCQF